MPETDFLNRRIMIVDDEKDILLLLKETKVLLHSRRRPPPNPVSYPAHRLWMTKTEWDNEKTA